MLPEYIPTLPPRKRARTKAEKEERRLQRNLRNRQAAHTSRVRKRKYLELLECYVKKLEQNCIALGGNVDRLSILSDTITIERANLVETDDLEQIRKQILAVSSSKGNASLDSNCVDSSLATPNPSEDGAFENTPEMPLPADPKLQSELVYNDVREMDNRETPAGESVSILPLSSYTCPTSYPDSNTGISSGTDRSYLSLDNIAYYEYLSSMSKDSIVHPSNDFSMECNSQAVPIFNSFSNSTYFDISFTNSWVKKQEGSSYNVL